LPNGYRLRGYSLVLVRQKLNRLLARGHAVSACPSGGDCVTYFWSFISPTSSAESRRRRGAFDADHAAQPI